MIDFDYKEKDGEKSVMYVMAIENFRTKLETARVGQVDPTKRFSINGSEFRIDLYVRGVDESNKDFIGLFVTNTNRRKVGVKFKVLAFKDYDNILKRLQETRHVKVLAPNCDLQIFVPACISKHQESVLQLLDMHCGQTTGAINKDKGTYWPSLCG